MNMRFTEAAMEQHMPNECIHKIHLILTSVFGTLHNANLSLTTGI